MYTSASARSKTPSSGGRRISEDVWATTLSRKSFVFYCRPNSSANIIWCRYYYFIHPTRFRPWNLCYTHLRNIIIIIIINYTISSNRPNPRAYCGCQNSGKLHFLYRLPSKYNIMSYYRLLLLRLYIYLCT